LFHEIKDSNKTVLLLADMCDIICDVSWAVWQLRSKLVQTVRQHCLVWIYLHP